MRKNRTWRDYAAVKENKVIEDYVARFGLTSFKNEVPALLSFFYISGQVVADFIRVPIWASMLDPRVHVFWIQPTRTGKTIAWEFIGEVLRLAGVEVEGFTSGTDAGLIGTISTYEEDGQEVTVTTPGALAGKKALNFDEGSILLQGDKKAHSSETILYLQQAMNPIGTDSNNMRKHMAKGLVETQSSVSFWITTYPPQGVKDVVLTKGLFQRVLLFVAHWDMEDRQEVSERRMSGAFKNVMGDAAAVEDLAAHFIQVRENCKTRLINLALQGGHLSPPEHAVDWDAHDSYDLMSEEQQQKLAKAVMHDMFTINERADWDASMLSCVDEFYGLLTGLDPQMKEIVCSFMPNVENYLVLFAVHIALTEQTWNLEGRHLEASLEIIYDVYERLVTWLETDVEVGQKRREKMARMSSWKHSYELTNEHDLGKAGAGWMQKSEVFANYMKREGKSKPATYDHYKKAKQWFTERKEGSIVYVRWKGE